jgi:hypothetical protein
MELTDLPDVTIVKILNLFPICLKNTIRLGKSKDYIEIVKLLSFFSGVQSEPVRDSSL